MNRWLFSARVDVAVFLGSAVLALSALAVLPHDAETPDWAWIAAVVLVDVAHVWATGFRVYADPEERARRPWLYAAVPIVSLLLGIALYSEGELVFWRVLAYVAAFHFVRQQYGWVALYRARTGERGGRWLDTAAVYAATLYPLIWWHAHLPRRFWWFLTGDFVALPALVARVAQPVYWAILLAYFVRAVTSWRHGVKNPGKHIVVATTALCWYVGIIACNGDYAFTVTNVLIHGIPYFALIYWYGRRRVGRGAAFRLFSRGPLPFLALLWAIAFVEELLWDRGVWHDRAWLFGMGWDLGQWKMLLVPLLALPQIVHYVLDGFVWRRKDPGFALVPRA